jgi:hypothetical protein
VSAAVHVAADSQCVSFLIDALINVKEPTDALADQRIALFRTYLYRDRALLLTPTVIAECKAIPNAGRAAHHESWISTFFGVTQPIDPVGIDARTAELLAIHNGAGDCRILAEAEDVGINVLLSFDAALISRLCDRTTVQLLRPLEFWESLNIPKGARPITVPHSTNPLATLDWWKW